VTSTLSLSSIESGDFNGDGAPDLVGISGINLVLLIGTGDGRFAPPHQVMLPQYGGGVLAVADVDSDGRSDVAVAQAGFSSPSQAVSVFLGMSDGTLGAPLIVPTEPGPEAVALGQVTGSADLDLIVRTANSRVWVFPGNGDGAFGAGASVGWTVFARYIGVNDINRDGLGDLVFGGWVAFGNGDGTFAAPSAISPGLPSSLPSAVGDWNGDGAPDLAVSTVRADEETRETSGSVTVALGRGDGTFDTPHDYAPFSGASIAAVKAGDFTADGAIDLIMLNTYPTYTVSLLVGRGDGTFGSKRDFEPPLPPISAGVLALADWDQDGRLDLTLSGTRTVTFLNRSLPPTPNNAPVISAPAEVVGSIYDPIDIRVSAVDPDLDPILALTADLSGLPPRHGATFSVSRDNDTGVLHWTPRATHVGTHLITFTATNALTATATTRVHVAQASGPPGGQLFQSFYEQFETGERQIRDSAIADFDRDGLPDLAALDDLNLSVFPGRGDATFSTPRSIPVEGTPSQLLLEDVNSDGFLDVVTAAGGALIQGSMYFGSRHGTFAPAIPFTGGSSGSFSIGGARFFALADLDRDLRDDVIVLDGDQAVGVLLANCDGTFQELRSLPAGTRPESIWAWDVNEDGIRDLVVLEAYEGVAIMMAPGDGTLRAPVFYAASGAFSVAAGDVNGDGHVDLAVARQDEGLSLFLGAGDGSFLPGASWGQPESNRVTLADMNGDGRDDVIAPAGLLDVFLSAPDGSPGAPRRTVSPGINTPIHPASLNRDGFLDLVAVESRRATIFTGNGDGTFGSGTSAPVGPRVRALSLAKFNSDDILDLAVAQATYPPPSTASVLLGLGDGSFGAKASYETGRTPYGMTVGDLNGDDRADLVVTNLEDYENAASILLGNGDGTFQQQRRVEVGPGPYSAAIEDFDLDGNMDLAVASFPFYSSGVRVALGNGDGTFRPPTLIQSIGNALSVAAGDLNGDGIADIAATEGANAPCSRGCGHAIFLLFGNGDGTFRAVAPLVTPTESEEVVIEDVNRDGLADLVLKTNRDVAVFLGAGGGTFLDYQTYATGAGLGGIALADVDGDGVKDVATANFYDASVSVLLGSGGGSFGRRKDFGAGVVPTSVALGDVNGDRRPDLVVGSDIMDVSVLLNLGPAPPPALQATITFSPKAVELRRRGGDLTAYIELPQGVHPGSIIVTTVRLDGKVPPRKKSARITDHDRDGIPDLRVLFDLDALGYLKAGARELTVSGLLTTGEGFEGRATLRIIRHGRRHGNFRVDVLAEPGARSVTIVSTEAPGVARTIEIFDVRGRLVRRWSAPADPELRAAWDGRSADGSRCGSGIYFVRVTAGDERGEGKIVFVR
jgi:hypothetical protein